MVNYLAGVKLEDDFRYVVSIVPSFHDDPSRFQSSKVTVYNIPATENNKAFKIVDTPSFGNQAGLEFDKQIRQEIAETLK